MPEKEIKKRGGAVRWRTIVPKPGRYVHVAVTRKAGPRGGKTVAGEVHRKVRGSGIFSNADLMRGYKVVG